MHGGVPVVKKLFLLHVQIHFNGEMAFPPQLTSLLEETGSQPGLRWPPDVPCCPFSLLPRVEESTYLFLKNTVVGQNQKRPRITRGLLVIRGRMFSLSSNGLILSLKSGELALRGEASTWRPRRCPL